MRTVQSIVATICSISLLTVPVAGQTPVTAADLPLPAPSGFVSRPGPAFRYDPVIKNFRQPDVKPINLRNSGRLEDLIRAGKLYLSLTDAIALALENNLDIELQRYGPALAEADLLRAQAGGFIRGVPLNVSPAAQSATANFLTGGFGGGTGAQIGANQGGAGGQSGTVFQVTGANIPQFDPVVTFGFQKAKTTQPQTNTFVSGTTALLAQTEGFNANFQKQWATGTGINMGWQQTNIFTNSPVNVLNPFNRGNINVQLTQSLLRGFGRSVNSRNIRISRNNLKVSDLVFKQQVISTVSGVVNLYLDLVSFSEDLKVREKAVGLAQKLYDDNRKQVEIGTLAPIEVVRAEAQLAQAKSDQIQSETRVLQQEAILKNALSRTGIASPTIQDVRIITVDRADAPQAGPAPPLNELIETAMKMRPELVQARVQIENTKIGLAGSRSQLLPQLDAFVSSTNNALSGSINSLPFPPGQVAIPRTADPFVVGGLGNFYGQIFRRNFPDYAVGFQLSVPILNRAAQADLINDTLNLRRQELQEQQTINNIRLDVQRAWIALQQASANYAAAQKARQLQEQTLDAEQKKFALGTSTIFVVVQTQRDLVNAQALEVSAINNYYRARNQLDVATGRVLEANQVDLSEALKGEVKRQSKLPTP